MSAPLTRRGAYARKLGITTHQLRRMGGMKRVKALTAAARRLLMPKKRHT